MKLHSETIQSKRYPGRGRAGSLERGRAAVPSGLNPRRDLLGNFRDGTVVGAGLYWFACAGRTAPRAHEFSARRPHCIDVRPHRPPSVRAPIPTERYDMPLRIGDEAPDFTAETTQ